jgi:hypothetical protein
MLFRTTSPGLTDIISDDPRIAVVFELDQKEADELRARLKEDMPLKAKIEAEWVSKSSNANIILIAVKNWKNMTYFENVPGMGAIVENIKPLPDEQRRVILAGQGTDGKIVTVVYNIPDLGRLSFDCLAGDFAKNMVEIQDIDLLNTCLEGQ